MKNSLKLTFLLLCTFNLLAWSSQAQQNAIHVTSVEDAHEHTPGRTCHAHINLQNQIQADPVLEERMRGIEEKTQRYIQEHRGSMYGRSTRVIPVYVHVIYRTSQENISNAQIQSQIDQLNADFAATNADYFPPSDFASVAAGNTGIQFNLVQVTRKQSNKTSWGTNDAMKKSSQGGVNPISPSTHLNMWVCNIGGGILGYAQFPGGSSSTDGVVMSPQYFGSNNYGSGYYLSAPFDRGRTTTHEVGHYLNLRHIWGDGGCSVDDGVSDTPVAGQSNGGCPSSTHNTCSGGQRDMHMNYMDYTDDACMYMFSAGQRDRMLACLATTRSSLGTTTGGGGGGSNCVSSFPYNESFDGSIGSWTQNSNDDINWTVRSGSTPSSNTGPSAAADGSHYIYTEASSGNDNKRAILTSPCFDLSGLSSGSISFKYHLYGGNMGTVSLQASVNGGSWSTLWSEGGNQGNSWQTATVNLGSLAGNSSVQLRFNGLTGSGWQSDIALDDFTISTSGGGGSGPSCPNTNVALNLVTDNYGSETTWTVKNSAGATVQSGSGYANNTSYNIALNLSAGDYTFTINDSYGDGICCSYGNGSYTLTANGSQLTTGGNFGSTASFDFCVGGSSRAARTAEEVAEISTEQINLYPNPAGNLINVDLNNTENNFTGRILDATGRTVWVGELEAGANAINITTLSAGLYYMAVVKTDGQVVTKKFVKK